MRKLYTDEDYKRLALKMSREMSLIPSIDINIDIDIIKKKMKIASELIQPMDNFEVDEIKVLIELGGKISEEVLQKYDIEDTTMLVSATMKEKEEMDYNTIDNIVKKVDEKIESEKEENNDDIWVEIKKETEKKKNSAKKNKKGKKGKKGHTAPYIVRMYSLLQEGKYTKNEIVNIMKSEFPDYISKVRRCLSLSKNPKYTWFIGELIDVKEDGVLYLKSIKEESDEE